MSAEKAAPDVSFKDDKAVPWYKDQLTDVNPDAKKILESYSGIPADQIIPHVLAVREKAWSIFPYPCIGGFRFLEMSLGLHPLYPEVLSRLKEPSHTSSSSSGEIYLDLGCCFGQDIRRLANDGVAPQKLHGSDLRHEFWDLGYELFLDHDRLAAATFVEADVLDPDSKLRVLDGRVDIMHAASFFHLFGYADQKKAARRIVELLKPRAGSLLIGRQAGNVNPGDYEHADPGTRMDRHNVDSWRRLWEEVGAETGTRWDVQAELQDWGWASQEERDTWNSQGMKKLIFSVRRL